MGLSRQVRTMHFLAQVSPASTNINLITKTDKGSKVFDNAVKKGVLRVESPGELPTKLLVKLSKEKRSRTNLLSKDS